jgi:hypothetical protein
MVVTIIEGRVTEENWPVLEQAYQRSAQQRPPGLVQSFLVHSWEDPEVWQIITVWNNVDKLRQMVGSGQTPRGILMFQEAKCEPTHGVFEIVQQRTIEAEHSPDS